MQTTVDCTCMGLARTNTTSKQMSVKRLLCSFFDMFAINANTSMPYIVYMYENTLHAYIYTYTNTYYYAYTYIKYIRT